MHLAAWWAMSRTILLTQTMPNIPAEFVNGNFLLQYVPRANAQCRVLLLMAPRWYF